MEQFDKQKTILYQLIGENKFILDILDFVRQRGDILPSINLSEMKSGDYSSDTNIIQIGVPNIIECYELALKYNKNLTYKLKFNDLYSNYDVRYKRCLGIELFIPEHQSMSIKEMVNDSAFLKMDDMSLFDVLGIYSLAYSLYHEIGHFILNRFIPETRPLCRECAADCFAFEALKSMKVTEEDEVLLLGAIIGITNMLRKPKEENEDIEHPHSIERLYALLDFWRITDDSLYWKFSFDEVYKWCIKYHMPIFWIKETSITYKEKFIDAYSHYRKILL